MKKFPIFMKNVDWLLNDSRSYAAPGVTCIIFVVRCIESSKG